MLRPLLSRLSLLLLGLALGHVAVAQPPGRGNGNERRSDHERRSQRSENQNASFFEALRAAFQENHGKDILKLLAYDEVREEIELSPEMHEQIRDGFRAAMSDVSQLRQDMRKQREADAEQELDFEQTKARILEIVSQHNESAFALLTEEQLERLLNILVQSQGLRAATNPRVASRIGLEEEERLALRAYQHRKWHHLMKENRRSIQHAIRDGKPRNEIGKLFHECEQRLNQAIRERLSADQLQRFEQLHGEPFDLPERGPGGKWRRHGEGGRSDRNEPQDN